MNEPPSCGEYEDSVCAESCHQSAVRRVLVQIGRTEETELVAIVSSDIVVGRDVLAPASPVIRLFVGMGKQICLFAFAFVDKLRMGDELYRSTIRRLEKPAFVLLACALDHDVHCRARSRERKRAL